MIRYAIQTTKFIKHSHKRVLKLDWFCSGKEICHLNDTHKKSEDRFCGIKNNVSEGFTIYEAI